MNLAEFSALKVGDEVDNGFVIPASRGTVCEVTDRGVAIAWTKLSRVTFSYSHMSTAWFHWTKVEYPPRDCTAGPCSRDDCRRADQCLGGDYDKIAAQMNGGKAA